MNRLRANLRSVILTTLVGVGGGYAFAFLGRSLTYQAMLILMASGALVLLLLAQFGLTREFLLMSLGFVLVLTPVKFFGTDDNAAIFTWTVQGYYVSSLDLVMLLLLCFFARDALSTIYRLVPKPVLLFFILYTLWMFLSLENVEEWEVVGPHLQYEAKGYLLFITVFCLVAKPGRMGSTTTLHYILIGFSLAMWVEFLIVCLEYVGILRTGMGFMGIWVGSLSEVLGQGETLRVGGTYQHPNALSVATGAAFLFLWQIQMDSKPEARRSLWYWPGIIGSFLCLVLTLSRGGYIGTAAGGCVYVGTMLLSRGTNWLKSLPWKYIAPAIISMFAIGFYFSDVIADKIFFSSLGNVTSRQVMNAMALQISSENPWIGAGIGQHGFAMMQMASFTELFMVLKVIPMVHNIYLLILTEVGIPGTVFFFLIPLYTMVFALRMCLRHPNHELAAALCGAVSAIALYLVADLASASLRRWELVNIYWLFVGIALASACTIREDLKKVRKPLS